MRNTTCVIVPVYNGFDVVSACLHSVLETKKFNKSSYEIIVVDDASSDEMVKDYLGKLSLQSKITLISNKSNLGFTKSVNIGMLSCPNSNVLLLNSDTVVYSDWMDRLICALCGSDKIGSVCPFTSHSHITFYPEANLSYRCQTTDEQIDRLASRVNKRRVASIYSSVGFCMLIKRECINQIGYFDEEQFPRGYGEEADFCLRATKLGWKHAVAGNVYVTHIGEKSFKGEKQGLMEGMLKKFDVLHPNFKAIEDLFKIVNPLRELRKDLDLARLADEFSLEGVLRLSFFPEHPTHTRIPELFLDLENRKIFFIFKNIKYFPNLIPYAFPADIRQLIADLRLMGISEILCGKACNDLILDYFTGSGIKISSFE